MSAEITKVTLKLGKREIEMSIEEARNLKAALENLFGKDVVREIVRDGCHHWHWGWNQPFYPIYGGGSNIGGSVQGIGTAPPIEPYTVSCINGNLTVGVFDEVKQ